MKTLLLLLLLIQAQAGTCSYHMKEATHLQEKATMSMKFMKPKNAVFYDGLTIIELIQAKDSCPQEFEDDIQKMIDTVSNFNKEKE